MSQTTQYPVATPRAYAFDAVYSTVPNWDIGRPQRAFVNAEQAGYIHSPVLDVGCGTGELSLFLARQGHDILGIDIAPRAVEQAKDKARWRRVPARFLIWDALDLQGLADAGLGFQTVVDSAMFHLFSDAERDRFVRGLGSVLESGGAYFVLGDARLRPDSMYGISPGELQTRFRPETGWDVAFITESVIERRESRSPAYFAGMIRRTNP